MNAEYSRLTKRLAVVLEAIRLLRNGYMSTEDRPAKNIILDERATYNEREVEEVYIQQFMEELLLKAADIERELSQFELRKRDEQASAEVRNQEQEGRGQGAAVPKRSGRRLGRAPTS